MKILAIPILIAAIVAGQATAAPKADPLCKPLRAFVASVTPDQSHELEFHTSWGSNFKNSSEPAILAKQCAHHGYGPAELACKALMEHGLVEFSNFNAQRAISCLSPATHFAPHVSLANGAFDLRYGTDDRGSHVTVEYHEDLEMGGMVLRVAAEGY